MACSYAHLPRCRGFLRGSHSSCVLCADAESGTGTSVLACLSHADDDVAVAWHACSNGGPRTAPTETPLPPLAAGKCPGPDDFQCCTTATCPGGRCLRTPTCGGTSTPGLCPGPANVQCCQGAVTPEEGPPSCEVAGTSGTCIDTDVCSGKRTPGGQAVGQRWTLSGMAGGGGLFKVYRSAQVFGILTRA